MHLLHHLEEFDIHKMELQITGCMENVWISCMQRLFLSRLDSPSGSRPPHYL